MSGGGKQPHHRLFQPHNPEPSAPPPQQDYGAFPGVLGDTSPSPPAIGFYQPAPPPWAISPSSGPPYYAEGRQAVPGEHLGDFRLWIRLVVRVRVSLWYFLRL